MRVLFTAQDSQTIRDAFDRAKPNTEYSRLYAAAVARRPLGLKRATWMIARRLLDYIEKHQGGRYERVKAENRLREFWPIWSEPQELCPG